MYPNDFICGPGCNQLNKKANLNHLRKYPATIRAVMHDSTHTSQVHADGRVALWLTGLAFTAIHVAFSGRYGFHRDELLSYSNAMHLD
jgi:hypothetical protein